MLDIYSPLARRRRAVRRHRRRERRADQVRLERLPGHQDLVHQRGRRSSARALGANVEVVAQGHGPRQPHRPQVPHRRPRLRRLLLPQGHPRGGPDRPRARPALPASSRRCVEVNERRQAPHDRQDRARRWAARSTARRSPCSASPSSRTPTTCASRRPCRSSCTACSTRGATVRAFDPEAMARRASPLLPADHLLRRTPTTPPRAPTRSSSCTEWNQFRKLELRPACKRAASRRRWWSTCATSTSPSKMAAAGLRLRLRRPARRRHRQPAPAAAVESETGA